MSPTSYQLLHSAMWMVSSGARGRTRTGMDWNPADFKSAASADSATRAACETLSYFSMGKANCQGKKRTAVTKLMGIGLPEIGLLIFNVFWQLSAFLIDKRASVVIMNIVQFEDLYE